MIKRVMEESAREEEARLARLKESSDQELKA